MAGEWIKVEKATPEKPEVLRIARELCIDRDAVFGKLMLVWMWFDANSYNGVVDGAVDADVDALARQQGFAAQMRACNWLTDSLLGVGLALPNFNRHNGETAKRRALSNRRQANWRNAHVDAPSVTNASTREEKRREEVKTKDIVRQKPNLNPQALEVLEFLNSKTGRQYKPKPGTLEPILARLREGSTVEDLRAVIAKKCREWIGDPKMNEYLRPKTLFNRTNFANYEGELASANSVP